MKEYKVVKPGSSVTEEGLETILNNLSGEGWKPILLSTVQANPGVAVSTTIVLERARQRRQLKKSVR